MFLPSRVPLLTQRMPCQRPCFPFQEGKSCHELYYIAFCCAHPPPPLLKSMAEFPLSGLKPTLFSRKLTAGFRGLEARSLNPNLPLQPCGGRKNTERGALPLRGDQRSLKAAPKGWTCTAHAGCESPLTSLMPKISPHGNSTLHPKLFPHLTGVIWRPASRLLQLSHGSSAEKPSSRGRHAASPALPAASEAASLPGNQLQGRETLFHPL